MRSAKEAAEDFPYCMKTMCYIEVDKNGNVSQIQHKNKSDRPKVLEAYQRAVNKDTTYMLFGRVIIAVTYSLLTILMLLQKVLRLFKLFEILKKLMFQQ